ncbi:MAG: cryptochrome/photolyase family protein [bacterium]
MSDVTLIFPHQLFADHPAIDKTRHVYLIEEQLFFNQYKFHKQKIILHRSSMKNYERILVQQGNTVHYIESTQETSQISELIKVLKDEGVTTFHYCDPTDYLLTRRIEKTISSYSLTSCVYDNPNFITDLNTGKAFFNNKKHFHQTDFYIAQRKRLKLFIDEDGGPMGGKWSFDADNREKLAATITIPAIEFPEVDACIEEAIQYTKKNYANNPGNITPKSGNYPWAWNSSGSTDLLEDFLKHRFKDFGAYEDAIAVKEKFIFHSVLSPMINNGLINPHTIIDQVNKHVINNRIPMNSLEGFIRQVIGWREFIRIVYEMKGNAQRTTNFWGFKRKIPPSFYNGTTGIAPVDDVIHKVLDNGYAHHIERLMILGNFFLLCEFDPDEVYKWFMELFIDAYDWVMVPNVYGMTQFADGGLMTTKPYISGSNYIFKMSDYKKPKPKEGAVGWDLIWDGLFWEFMNKQRGFFLSNPRLGMLIRTYDKMSDSKKEAHRINAQLFLNKIDKEHEKAMEQS